MTRGSFLLGDMTCNYLPMHGIWNYENGGERKGRRERACKVAQLSSPLYLAACLAAGGRRGKQHMRNKREGKLA